MSDKDNTMQNPIQPELELQLSEALLAQLRGMGTSRTVVPAAAQLLHLLMENMQDLVFWKDANLIYRGCNYSFARAVGFSSPSDIVGKTDEHIIEDHELVQAYMEIDREVLASDLPYISYDFMCYQPGSLERKWVRTYKYPIKNELGAVSGILGIVREDRDTVYVPVFPKP
ncbi:MAG: PAS domain-containing protein [Bacteroidetes bacterium]|nr:PAS domain-containing protein [Bacteroidota bacterium]